MIYSKQAEANRRNAQNSTGPRTEEGKQRSSMNALKHGLTAESVVLPGEDAAQFDALQQRFMEEYAPQTVLETELVKLIAGCVWRLKRVPVFERAILLAYKQFNDQLDIAVELNICTAEATPSEVTGQTSAQIIEKYQSSPEKEEYTPGERKAYETYLDHKAAWKEFKSPAVKLGRALVLQGNGLDAVSKLNRHETSLLRTLENYVAQLVKEQAKRTTP